jgi:hypothetical protein
MSLSVGSSSTNNPYAYIQALLQQEQSQGGATAGQSDPLSALFAAFNQQGPSATSPAGAGSSPAASSPPGNTFPQFGSQMLQALLALQQTSGSGSPTQSPQSPSSPLGADGSPDTSGATSDSQQTQGQSGHHHHHHHMDGANGAGGGGQSPFQLLAAADNGATSQTSANANGSDTTTITFADGSTVSMTTAPPSGSSTSTAATSPPSGGANVAGNNLLEQLIQMQAQLLTPAATQSLATV